MFIYLELIFHFILRTLAKNTSDHGATGFGAHSLTRPGLYNHPWELLLLHAVFILRANITHVVEYGHHVINVGGINGAALSLIPVLRLEIAGASRSPLAAKQVYEISEIYGGPRHRQNIWIKY